MAIAKTSAKKAAKALGKRTVDFAGAYAELQEILAAYEKDFHVVPNKPGGYWLETKCAVYRGKPLLFAAVALNKSYVSYHLMPIYVKPELGKGISAELKKRKQGKCCFNFTAPDAELFKELSQLTREGFACYQDKNFFPAMNARLAAGTRKKAAAVAH
jgi:hypothetical protein